MKTDKMYFKILLVCMSNNIRLYGRPIHQLIIRLILKKKWEYSYIQFPYQ